MGFFPQVALTKILYALFSHPHILHTPPFSLFLTWFWNNIWWGVNVLTNTIFYELTSYKVYSDVWVGWIVSYLTTIFMNCNFLERRCVWERGREIECFRWSCKDCGGSGFGLLWSAVMAFAWRTEKITKPLWIEVWNRDFSNAERQCYPFDISPWKLIAIRLVTTFAAFYRIRTFIDSNKGVLEDQL